MTNGSVADPDSVKTGQAVYSRFVLRTYDWLVLGISNHLLWRCPTADLRRLYDRNVTGRHLDIGVGTGYFLDKARWPVAKPSITLLDLNTTCLRAAANRIRRFAPRAVVANVLAPLPSLERFNSVGLCYLLHCLPGTIIEKAIVFDYLKPYLSSGARVFGATIVQGNTSRSTAAQAVMDLYNSRGIFSNANDTIQGLSAELRKRFIDVKTELKGTVALFDASAP